MNDLSVAKAIQIAENERRREEERKRLEEEAARESEKAPFDNDSENNEGNGEN